MQSLRLGRVSVNPRGPYDPAAEYERLDMVGYEEQGYIALRHSQGVKPADGEDWMLVVGSGNAKLAQSWAVGNTGVREGENTDNAKFYAELAQSISQGAQGWYPDYGSLKAAHETGVNGQWAIIGSTDTIWTWDSDSGDWKDSHQTTDLSNYYTKEQTEGMLAEKLGKTEKAVSASILETTAGAPNLTVKEDNNNVWLQVANIKNSDVFDKFDIVIAKNDGHAWIHEYKGSAGAEGDLVSQKIYTSSFPQLSVTGNAGTATKLAAPQTINGVAFDGTAPITVYDATKQLKHKTLSLLLDAASWDDANTCTVGAEGVTGSNTVLISPAPASWTAWGECGVRCTAQGANSLTFTAEEKPIEDITAQVFILD